MAFTEDETELRHAMKLGDEEGQIFPSNTTDEWHQEPRSTGFQLLPALTTEKPAMSNSSVITTEDNRGAEASLGRKGRRAFQPRAKSVLTGAHTSFLTKATQWEDRSYRAVRTGHSGVAHRAAALEPEARSREGVFTQPLL